MVEAAERWYRQGVGVVPIKPGSKRAAITWKHLQTRRVPWPVVRGWFTGANSSRNLGLLCGAVSGGLCVLDFDDLATWTVWREIHKYHLGESYSVKTPRGAHVYLYSDDLPGQSFAMENVDIKVSGYVLAAGSTHPTGIRYEVHQPGEVLRVAVLDVALVGLERPKEAENNEGGTGPPSHFRPVSAHHTKLQAVKLYPGVAQDIKRRLSILDVCNRYTTMSGPGASGYFWGTCPSHADSTPSLSCDLGKQRAHCWASACRLHSKRGLDVIDLTAILEGLSARDSMARLALELALVEVA